MLELSPEDTAANACASGILRLEQRVPVEPDAEDLLAVEVRAQPAEGAGIAVDHRHRMAGAGRAAARASEPTRPQPMITMCTLQCPFGSGSGRQT